MRGEVDAAGEEVGPERVRHLGARAIEEWLGAGHQACGRIEGVPDGQIREDAVVAAGEVEFRKLVDSYRVRRPQADLAGGVCDLLFHVVKDLCPRHYHVEGVSR